MNPRWAARFAPARKNIKGVFMKKKIIIASIASVFMALSHVYAADIAEPYAKGLSDFKAYAAYSEIGGSEKQ